MRTRLPLLGILGLLAIWIATPDASAQECRIGIYGSEEGVWSSVQAEPFGGGYYQFEFYYVVHTEGWIYGVAWQRETVGEFTVEGSQVYWQDYATFLETREEGYRIGLGLCRWGGGDQPITIMREWVIVRHHYYATKKSAVPSSPVPERAFRVVPNTLQNAEHVMVADCAGDLRSCESQDELYVYFVVPTEGTSFSRMKAMFR